MAGHSAWWTATKSDFSAVPHWIKPKFPNIFFSTVMKMFSLQCFLITAAGIYGSSWTISNGSARCDWETQVCCADSCMCCSGLPSSARKHLRISDRECFKSALFTHCIAKICPITYCNYDLKIPISILTKYFWFHLYFRMPLASLLPIPVPQFPFWKNKIFPIIPRKILEEAVHVYKEHWTGK